MEYRGEFSLKFAIQTASHYTVPELVRFATLAHDEGFKQVWINDNLGQRNIFVVLAAIAAQVPIQLGTSIVVPYFRNPVDIADSLAALSELTGGRELSVGIARGEPARAGCQIEVREPLAMVREATLAIRALTAGETVSFRDFPTCAAYHHIRPEHQFRLAFSSASPLRFYCGGHGPKILRVAGEIMDGVLFGDHFIPLARAGRIGSLLAIARSAAGAKRKVLFDVCELDISVARDRQLAIDFARPFAAQVLMNLALMGFPDDKFHALGIEPRLVQALANACTSRATVHSASKLLPDSAVTSCFVAGSPEECRDQLAALLDEAAQLNIGQIAFAKLGPDYDEAITLLRREVLPN